MANIIATYAGSQIGPKNPDVNRNINDLKSSGFNTVIIGLLHIAAPWNAPTWKLGDIILNSPDDSPVPGALLVRDGQYVGEPSWPGTLESLLTGTTSVVKLGFSFGGGPPVRDFEAISTLIKGGHLPLLVENMKALRNAFPFVSFIDMDCEELGENQDYNWISTVTDFSQLVNKLGFAVTICPFGSLSGWSKIVTTLNAGSTVVQWANLQCYAGGSGNQTSLPQWINAFGKSFIKPGLWSPNNESPSEGLSPEQFRALFYQWNQEQHLGLTGGFMWTYDELITANPPTPYTVAEYAAAIQTGLGN